MKLYRSILERWRDAVPANWSSESCELSEKDIWCQKCYVILSEYEGSFHVHHMYDEDSIGTAKGGWQHLQKLEEDFFQNTPLYVTCEDCHRDHHQCSLFEELDIE